MPGASALEVALAIRRDMLAARVESLCNGTIGALNGTAFLELDRFIEYLGGETES